MVNQVVIADVDPEQAYQQGKQAAQQRPQEERHSSNGFQVRSCGWQLWAERNVATSYRSCALHDGTRLARQVGSKRRTGVLFSLLVVR